MENFKLEEIIGPRSLIETRQRKDNNWVITVVQQCFGNYIEIRQVEEYLTSVLMIGDRVQCRFMAENLIYVIEAEVYNIKIASQSVVLKAYDLKTLENTRKHKRYDVYLSASYNRRGTPGEIYCVIINASSEGLSILTRNKLELDEIINISIYFRGYHFLMAKCSVKWADSQDENYLYGVEIEHMDELSKERYKDFLRKLQRKERLLRKKGARLFGSDSACI